MAVGNIYTAKKICPVCGEEISVTKVRSRLISVKTDDDFCVHYKDFNPYYYAIWVCEKCGYAADENHFTGHMHPKHQELIRNFLNERKIGIEHHEERSLAEAVSSYKLAIFFAELISASASHIAGLYLKLAWIYRDAENKEKEDEALAKAVECYDKSLATERYPMGTMTDNAVIYLIGAIHKRLGNYESATQYLSRVIGDQRARSETTIFNKARDLWQDIRSDKETPEHI